MTFQNEDNRLSHLVQSHLGKEKDSAEGEMELGFE